MPPDVRIREPNPGFPKLPFADILPALSRYYEARAHTPFIEYKVDGVVTVNQLRSSLALPFELWFTQDHSEVVISPNIPGNERFDPNNRYQVHEERVFKSGLFAHTHNKRSDNKVIDTLSLQDLRFFPEVSDNTTTLLIHDQGISQFRRPIYCLDGTPINKDLRPASMDQAFDIWYAFQEEKDFHPLLMQWGMQKVDIDRQTALAQEFAKRTGMLVAEANWDEEGISTLVEKLNLQSS